MENPSKENHLIATGFYPWIAAAKRGEPKLRKNGMQLRPKSQEAF
jgi:hypothetical protein